MNKKRQNDIIPLALQATPPCCIKWESFNALKINKTEEQNALIVRGVGADRRVCPKNTTEEQNAQNVRTKEHNK